MNPDSPRPRRPTIATLRERQREAVTASLLDAAEAVIDARGVADAGMAEIAKKAGVAVGTLYNYFPDRDGLVRALLDARRAAIGPEIRRLLDDAPGRFEPRLRRFVHDVLALFDRSRRFVRLAFEVNPQLNDRCKNRAVTDTLRGCLRELLDAGVAEGAVRKVHPDLQVRLLGAAIKSELLHQLETDGAFTSNADALVDLFLDGVRK